MTEDDPRLQRARDGDLAAFNELVLEYQGRVFSLCMLGSRPAAEDAAQDAFVSAWRSLGGLRGTALRPWLLRISANLCRDELRRRGRRPATSLEAALEEGLPEPAAAAPTPERAALDEELRQGIEAALLDLPPEQRLAVILCDIEQLDYAEIASVMRSTLGTVKSRIARGRARLRDRLQAEPELLPARFRQESRR